MLLCTKHSEFQQFQEFNEAEAYWQLRINDLPSCLAMTRLPARPGLSFNLYLADPISEYLADDQAWQGIGGDYTIHFGEQSEAMPGHKKNLPVLHAAVGGFSRLWLGSVRANALAVTEKFMRNKDYWTNWNKASACHCRRLAGNSNWRQFIANYSAGPYFQELSC
ncbi:MAG TPA: hypothetical protein DCS89_00840, partial [Gammaproteobacteria bacterium]|nr:hypothetical protein [Gammaproteobacteria bacterium]